MQPFAMENTTCTNLTEVVRSVRLLKVDGFSLTSDMRANHCFKSRWNVDGYDWEISIYPKAEDEYSMRMDVALLLTFLSEARTGGVKATLRCRLVDPNGLPSPLVVVGPRGRQKISEEHCQSITFRKPQDTSSKVVFMERSDLAGSGYIKDDSFTVQCTLEVLKEVSDTATAPLKEVHLLPSSDLHKHLAELLESNTGVDITFLVSGESFAAHKLILAARSPVFMAEFFGDMRENCSQCVEIKDMEASVFKALLHFIYTDTVPEFGQQEEAGTMMAQHLLVAADRYALDRLKLICIVELSGGITVDTAATTLAIAEQHNCPELKAKCVEFITGTSTTLDAVLATEGYKHLEASCPLVVIDLLKSARGRSVSNTSRQGSLFW